MADRPDKIWLPASAREPEIPMRDRLQRMSQAALQAGRNKGQADDSDTKRQMRLNRRANLARTGQYGGGSGTIGGSNITFATGRPRDPMWYWRQNNLPFDIEKDEELKRIREFARLIYLTHPLMASAIDIFSKFPITGMELTCKDSSVEDFYNTLFFDQLHYQDFLVDVGREHWTVGEAWPLGSFNETLGVWEDDELLNPDGIEVLKSPFLRNPRFEMDLPDTIKEVLDKKEPRWEYEALIRSYPELQRFSRGDKKMPVSNVLLKQIKFQADTFHSRGLPIMMRAIRSLMQEEMLNAALDAIASRLYTPLILVKLGASASDLGTDYPWVPEPGDVENFEEALDAALAADFRVLIHHFGVQMENVFGREAVPDLSADFDRIQDNQLQVFGLSKTMMQGGQAGETYAADAMNRDLITQLMTHYQRQIENLYKDRAYVVAEAQEHYDFEERGGKRYPIMEEVLEIDEETGEERIVEQPKLLIPEINFRNMNMAEEDKFHQLVEALVDAGVPISMKTRTVHIRGVDLGEEMDKRAEEAVDLAVRNEEARKRTYQALADKGLPIPEDLRADFEPKTQQAGNEEEAAAKAAEQNGNGTQPVIPPQQPLPALGQAPVTDNAALAPTGKEIEEASGGASGGDKPQPGGSAPGGKLPQNRVVKHRPAESDEQRAKMPKPARKAGEPLDDDDGGRLVEGPSVVGLRRFSSQRRDEPSEELDYAKRDAGIQAVVRRRHDEP